MTLELCLATIEPSCLWNLNEIDKTQKAFDQIVAYQDAMKASLVQLIHSPLLQSKFPQITAKCKECLSIKLEVRKSDFSAMSEPLMKHLVKEGQLTLTETFVEKVEAVFEEAKLFLNKELSFSEHIQVRQFVAAFKGFLERNLSSWKDFSSMSNAQEEAAQILDQIDMKYLKIHNATLEKYTPFFRNMECIVNLMARAQFERQPIAVSGDNPADVGKAIHQEMKSQAVHQRLKELTEAGDFQEKAVRELEGFFQLQNRYFEARDLDAKYQIAQEIIESDPIKGQSTYVSLRLDVYSVISLKTEQFPQLFKGLAQQLCKSFEELDKKKEKDTCKTM